RAAVGVLAGACAGAGLAAAAMVLIGAGTTDISTETTASGTRATPSDGAVTIPARLGSVAPAGAASEVGPLLYQPLSRFSGSVVNVEVDEPDGRGSGCGFSLDGGNTIVTTTGLVGNATDVYVTPAGGVRTTAVVLGTDAMTGVAVLRAASATLPALSAPDASVGAGDVVMSYTPQTAPPIAMGEVTAVGVEGTGPQGQAVLDAMETDLP